MNIKIIAVGKIKEKYLTMALDEYGKRLKSYCRLEIIEVKDEKIEERFSDGEKQKAVCIEGERILKNITENAVVATLEINGKQLSSTDFSKRIEAYGLQGKSSITFIIGGSLGLSPEVRSRSDWSLSFSKMTFPHQLFRVFLLEQIYRAFKIMKNETYHK
ncbi:MAG: 23S rRNA (pseudouridine(1915)-N(3))-methyltransferase RlmH [Eubacterium sp.]